MSYNEHVSARPHLGSRSGVIWRRLTQNIASAMARMLLTQRRFCACCSCFHRNRQVSTVPGLPTLSSMSAVKSFGSVDKGVVRHYGKPAVSFNLAELPLIFCLQVERCRQTHRLGYLRSELSEAPSFVRKMYSSACPGGHIVVP